MTQIPCVYSVLEGVEIEKSKIRPQQNINH